MANILSPTETWDPTASHQGQALEYGRKLDPYQVRLKSRCQGHLSQDTSLCMTPRVPEESYTVRYPGQKNMGVIHSEVSWPEDPESHAQ